MKTLYFIEFWAVLETAVNDMVFSDTPEQALEYFQKKYPTTTIKLIHIRKVDIV